MNRSHRIQSDKPIHPRHPFDDLPEQIWDDREMEFEFDLPRYWWLVPAVIGLAGLAALVLWGR